MSPARRSSRPTRTRRPPRPRREDVACPRRRDLRGSPPPRAAAQQASSSGCAPFTWRWSTPSWAATASTRWRRSRPTPRARPWRSSSRASAPRWRRRRRRRRTSRRCGATSPIASRTARRRCRRRSAAEVPIMSGDDVVGAVLMLIGPSQPGAEAGDFLHLAAVASLTEVAVEEAKEEVEQNLRGSFLEDLRSRPDLEPREVVRRAGRLGCDLSRGAVVLCAELTTDRPRHVVATIAEDHPGALAQHMDGRVYALLPAVGRRRRARADARARAAPGRAPAPARHGRPVELLRRPGRVRPRDPGGRARARRPAPVRRADRAGHRHRAPTGCSSACSPRIPRRCARSTRTPSRRSSATTTSTAPTSSARSRPTSTRTAT